MVEQLTLGIIVVAALLDSINPCVFGVLIFLLAYMTAIFKSKTKMLIAGLIYVSSVYITYLLIGLGLLRATSSIGLSQTFYWIAALIAVLAGLFEIKDFFWYGRGFSLQMIPGGSARIKRCINTLRNMEKKHPSLSLLFSFLIGIFVVFVELPCTGAPYLAVLGLLSSGQFSEGVPLLLLYNLIFVLPLFLIISLVYFGKTSRALEKWRKKNRGLMRLLVGLFLLALGAYMIYSII
jgi:cytochrome c biogenesis protein CcdA